ncbi:MAG: hypothetical protein ACOYKD_01075 [Anaerolineaceae bacterium]|jgi:DMSO/TMAO reductase YedYZ molybdopterin-dependent catalytic subunit
MKKFLFVLLIGVVLLSAGCQPAATPPTTVETKAPDVQAPTEAALPVTVLELEHGDEVIYFTMEQLKALPAVEGLAGIMSSTGKITPPAMYKGVLVSTLLEQVGGLKPENSVEILASDGYSITYSPGQILDGQYTTYDVANGDETKTVGKLQTIIAYEREGKPLNNESEGELRLAIIGESNLQVVDGHWSIKFVNKIRLKEAIEDWVVDFVGGIDAPMDRATFESGAAPDCHPATWKDPDGREYLGIPLYYLLGRVDDEVKHGPKSYRDDLAKSNAYTVDIIAKDGYTVTLDAFTTMRNDDIIVAYLLDGKPLEGEDFPLKLVGPELTKKQMVGGIAKVQINFGAAEAAAPEPVPSEEAANDAPISEVPAVLPPADAVLTLTGLVGEEKPIDSKSLVELFPVVNTTVEHPKKGNLEVTGIPFAEILKAAGVKPEAKTVVFIAKDGYKTEIALDQLQACEKCLVGWTEEQLLTYMPGFESSAWAKDLATIEFK